MNSRSLFVPTLLVALTSLTACGDGAKPKPIDLSKYDRSCTADSDCVTVETDPCTSCPCATDPINKKDEATFTAEFNDAAAQCPYDPYAPASLCAQCKAKIVTCTDAVCTPFPVM